MAPGEQRGPWEPRFCGNGWRACRGCVMDGRLFESEAACWPYCRALECGE